MLSLSKHKNMFGSCLMFNRAAGFLLGLVFPASCRICKSALHGGRFFCPDCNDKIKPVGDNVCTVCGRPFIAESGPHACYSCIERRPPYTAARAGLIYEGVAREAIHLYKYRHVRALKDRLGEYAADGAARWFPDAEIACAVPLHKKRFRERGFNQSLFLAKSASDALRIPLSVDGLVRTRYTRPQVDLGPSERAANVKGAFAVVSGEFEGRAVLLVDDVFTTGATVSECARVLNKAGAAKVYVLTVARVGRE